MKPSEPLDVSPEFFNDSSSDMHIGVQAGIVHDVAIYQVTDGQTPAQKIDTAIRRLNGGIPREAEKLLGEVVLEGHAEPRAAYYWALSILGGRTRDQLEEGHLRSLEQACSVVSKDSGDAWGCALDVIHNLVDLLLLSDGREVPEPPNQAAVLKAYDSLDPERSAEIRRHLDQILDGVLLESIYQKHMKEVESERKAGNRSERAPKFFEPEPAEPERVLSDPRPPRKGAWAKLTAAVVVVLIAGGPILRVQAENPVLGLLGAALLLPGLAGLARYRLRRESVRDARELEIRKYTAPTVGGRPWNGQREAPFFNSVTAGAFGKVAPADKEEKKQWRDETEGYRLNLTKQFANYRNPTVHSKQSKLRWLARWHAEQLARKWNESLVEESAGLASWATRLMDFARAHVVGATAMLATAAGAALCWWTQWTHGSVVDYLFLSALLLCGVRVAYDQVCWLVGTARSYERAEEASRERYRSELEAYRRWCGYLADKPEDMEMARWLDFDKRYLRFKAMELCGVSVPNVVAHVTLSRPHWNQWAKVTGGPRRYLSYIMTVILMTRSGVRLSRFHLDVRTGEVRALDRRSFRYDAIASVQVDNVPIRIGPAGDPASASEEGSEEGEAVAENGRQRYRATFRIVLLNQDRPIDTPLDVEEELDDSQEESHELMERAIQVPGVSGALRMMEGISGDGKEWLQAEENRGRRRRHTRPPTSEE